MNLISECGRYRLSTALVNGQPVYSLWRIGHVPALHTGTKAECMEAAK